MDYKGNPGKVISKQISMLDICLQFRNIISIEMKDEAVSVVITFLDQIFI